MDGALDASMLESASATTSGINDSMKVIRKKKTRCKGNKKTGRQRDMAMGEAEGGEVVAGSDSHCP